MSVSPEAFLFTLIVGRKMSLFASRSRFVRKPLQLGFGHLLGKGAHRLCCSFKNVIHGIGQPWPRSTSILVCLVPQRVRMPGSSHEGKGHRVIMR